MSSIRKDGKNYMIFFYWNGKKYQRSLKVPTRKLAQEMQNRYDQLLAQNVFPDDILRKNKNQVDSLKGLEDEFKDYLKKYKDRYSKKTIKAYEYNLKVLNDICGDIDLARITKARVEKDIIPYLYANYKNSTVRHFVTHFRAIFSKAVDWGLIETNPFSKMVPKADKKKPRYFSLEEIEILKRYFLNTGVPAWQYILVFLGLNTGLRKFELFNLTWKQIDLNNQQIIVPGKGKKERLVPLNESSMSLLEKYRIDIGRVFHEVNSIDSIGSAWQRMRTRTKLDIRFHDIRTTYASYYIMNGGNVMRLKEILGHEDIQTTMIYAGLSKENLHQDKNVIGF